MSKFFKISFLVLFVFIFSDQVLASYRNPFIKPYTIIMIKSDSPSFIDLMVYLPSMSRIIEFCEQHKKILTINLIHGLFLINVNLGHFVKDNDIPEALRLDMEKLLARSDKLQHDFNNSKGGKMKKLLAALASNATSWSNRLQKLNYDLLKKTHAYGEYPKWNVYLNTVENIDKGIPTPHQSDICVGSLVESEENVSNDPNWRCEVPDECYKSVINGTDFGYWLTHRLILLLHARLGRNCAIFSSPADKLFRADFCEKAYREAEYIAFNGFEIVDLLLEQIAICALDGHAQFLRRSWLLRILDYQQPSGCFQLYKVNPNKTPNIKECNDHAMAVALATYAAAVRLILDNLTRSIA